MDALALKQWIKENNKIETILSELQSHGVKEYTQEFRCGLPNKQNITAVTIKKETLSVIIRTSEDTVNGDIYTLVMRIKNMSFGESIKYLHNILGLKYQNNNFKNKKKQDVFDPLYVFRKHLKARCVVNEEIEIFDETAIKEYTPLPHISFIRIGIMPFTCKRFNIGFAHDRMRVVIPWRYYCGGDNDYIGIVGRTVVPNYELLGIPKYTKLSKTFHKSLSIYGLNENYRSIQEAKYVNVFEAEKSCLLRHSRKDSTGVAIGSHSLSDTQVAILISLNVNICICYDNDIPINHIRRECSRFYGIRNIYYIKDRWEVLGEKDSPADAPNRIFEFLWKHRVKYDEQEHKKYLEAKNNK